MKGTKRLADDVTDIFATHAGLVHNVTMTDCQTQNGSSHLHFPNSSSSFFSSFFFFKKLDHKST